jgi:hypothetical protein
MVFLPMVVVLIPRFHNHGLWSSFILFCAVRSAVEFFYWRKLLDSIIGENFSAGRPRHIEIHPALNAIQTPPIQGTHLPEELGDLGDNNKNTDP